MGACFYCGMVWPLMLSLGHRLVEDSADYLVALRRRLLYSRYDDVLPPDPPETVPVVVGSCTRATGPARLPDEKCDGKRTSTTVKSNISDPRPPVPNRPLPPTPRPHPETNSSSDTSKGGLLISNFENQPWFHNVDRKQAEELIKNGIDGYFLIRPSSQSQNPLTLTLWFNHRVYNISVRQRKDGRIALGFEKPDEQSFSSIEEMVINYQSENLLLFSRNERTGRTVLTKSPPREN